VWQRSGERGRPFHVSLTCFQARFFLASAEAHSRTHARAFSKFIPAGDRPTQLAAALIAIKLRQIRQDRRVRHCRRIILFPDRHPLGLLSVAPLEIATADTSLISTLNHRSNFQIFRRILLKEDRASSLIRNAQILAERKGQGKRAGI